MSTRAIEPREGAVAVRFALPAERLRMKGQMIRITDTACGTTDYLVTNVSDPDESGAVFLTVKSV